MDTRIKAVHIKRKKNKVGSIEFLKKDYLVVREENLYYNVTIRGYG